MDDRFRSWERRTFRTAIVFACLALLISAIIATALRRTVTPWWLTVLILLAPAVVTYAGLTRKIRRRRSILTWPFPPEWEIVLQREVVFYRALDPVEQKRFRHLLQIFIAEKHITGIKVQLDTTTRVLAAASAVIPIFGFPEN